jgi:hypothetical protein
MKKLTKLTKLTKALITNCFLVFACSCVLITHPLSLIALWVTSSTNNLEDSLFRTLTKINKWSKS